MVGRAERYTLSARVRIQRLTGSDPSSFGLKSGVRSRIEHRLMELAAIVCLMRRQRRGGIEPPSSLGQSSADLASDLFGRDKCSAETVSYLSCLNSPRMVQLQTGPFDLSRARNLGAWQVGGRRVRPRGWLRINLIEQPKLGTPNRATNLEPRDQCPPVRSRHGSQRPVHLSAE
jgi:hypothetical protein